MAHKETTSLDDGGDNPKQKEGAKAGNKKTTSKQSITKSLHKGFDFVEEFGGWVEVAGVVLAIPTEGVTLTLTAFGSRVTLIGHLGNTAVDVYEVMYEGKSVGQAVYRQGKYYITAGLGKVIDRVAPGVIDNLILKASLYVQDKFVLPTFERKILINNKK